MKKPKGLLRLVSYIMIAGILGFLTTMVSCNKDEEPSILTIVSIVGTGTDFDTGSTVDVDLNTSTSPTGVPLDVVIKITFDREVDPATATTSNFSLLDEDDNVVTSSVTASGATVTLDPAEDLDRGTDYSLSLGAGILAADGGTFTTAERSFKAAGIKPVDPPKIENMVAYWNFDGDANDQIGGLTPSAEIAITYGEDRHGQAESAVYFDGNESIIEYPSGSSLIDEVGNFTISFWVKTNSADHLTADGNPAGNFVLGLAAFFGIQYEIAGDFHSSKFAISYINDDGEGFNEDMWFPSNATDKDDPDGFSGWTFAKSIDPITMESIIKDKWYNVIYTFDGTERVGSLYFNGELMKSFDFDLFPSTLPIKQKGKALKYRGTEPDVKDELAFGFIQSRGGTMWDTEPWGGYDFTTANHFKGWLDDIRIFHTTYSTDDVASLYGDEK